LTAKDWLTPHYNVKEDEEEDKINGKKPGTKNNKREYEISVRLLNKHSYFKVNKNQIFFVLTDC
jgi:hypothetical protein